jgi:hypothetical protein
MAKKNEFSIEGTIIELSEPKFLQSGAEVQTIVIGWNDGSYECKAAVEFYAKDGLKKLHALNLKVGDTISVPVQPSSKVREGEGANGPWRFWSTNLRGDSWNVAVLNSAEGGQPAPDDTIDF